FRRARFVLAVRIGPRRLARRFVVAELAIVERIAGGGLRAVHRALGHVVRRRIGLIGTHLLRGIGIGGALRAGLIAVAVRIVLVVVLVSFRVALVAEIERGEQIVDHVAEPDLILGDA